MGKTFDQLDLPISYEPSSRSPVDRAFERQFWPRRQQVGRTFDRPSTGRPWLVWLLIIFGVVAVGAFSVWPGAGISRDASRTAVGSDAVWNGVIRQTSRPVAKEAKNSSPRQSGTSPVLSPIQVAAIQVAAIAPIQPTGQSKPVEVIKTVAMPAAVKSVAVPAPESPQAPAEDSPGLGDPTVLSIQGLLQRLGYEPGPIDGLTGSRTSAAIMAWQLDQGLDADGESSQQVLQWLLDPVGVRQAAIRLSIKSLSTHERGALETWCTTGRSSADLSGYYRCLNAQMVALVDGFRLPEPGVGGVTAQSVKFARASCTNALAIGPQNYFQCVGARSQLGPEIGAPVPESEIALN